MRKLISFRGPVFWAKTLQIVLLGIVTIAMLGAGQSRYERLGHKMMCACTCGQVLIECNHVGCPDSTRMLEELKQQIATGNPDTAVLNWFVAKYGAIVLAAPIRGGFDNVAWIVPISLFFLATAGTFAVVWIWKRRALRLAGPAAALNSPALSSPEDAALRERIRRETEY
jgi:cytochrome c-type biogenesis protein CcmH/NrfF